MKRILSIYIYLFMFSVSLLGQDNIFTSEEKQWIKENPIVLYGADKEWVPFDYIEKGKHAGVSNDILNEVAKISGLEFHLYSEENWDNVLMQFKRGEIDLLPALYHSEKREKYMRFTDKYLNIADYFFTQVSTQKIKSEEDVHGKKIAVVRGYQIESWLRLNHPQVELVLKNNLYECLEALSIGEVYGFVGDLPSTFHLLKKYFITNIKVNSIIRSRDPLSLHMGVHKKLPLLEKIISKSLQQISEDKKSEIFLNYVGLDEYTTLSTEEKKWIRNHPVITYVGDPNWLPFEAYTAEGNYIGIVAEYLKKIEDVTGLEFKVEQTASWKESIALMKSKKIDVISETTDSEMTKYLKFSNSYFTDHIVIVMQNDTKYVDSLLYLSEDKIAVIKEYGYVEKIKKAYPDMEFLEVSTITEGLKAVSSGKVDALLCTMTLGSYHISKDGFVNLRIVGKTKFSTSLGFGVQEEMLPLVSILNKAIASLDEGKKQDILKKWITQKYVEKIDYTLVWQILGIALFSLAVFLYWNRKMTKEIKRRVIIEKKLHETSTQVKESIEFASMIQRALIPTEKEFEGFFSDSFTLWKPRDIVGGDIYFFETLRHKDEGLLMVIDCTGHGVPGAFITMLVKALERNMIGFIQKSKVNVSPAELLQVFNKSMKHLLQQHDKSSKSNAGFDVAILYINKKDKLARFAGAELSLYYQDGEKIKRLKGNRQSVGYRNSELGYVYKDYEIALQNEMKFYITTDGYEDQNGGAKGFPFGRKKFNKILEETQDKSMHEVKEALLQGLLLYQGEYEANDDITILGVKI